MALPSAGPAALGNAEALLDTLIAAIASLSEFLERGPVPPELEGLGIRAYRQLSLAPYRVIYLPEQSVVTVMIIADARRDFRTLLQERLLR